ncbi:MAG: dehydrogenase [Planctomycetaceae bacterium]|nr:dehydrogenase [Planctomycetaceae bacterium]
MSTFRCVFCAVAVLVLSVTVSADEPIKIYDTQKLDIPLPTPEQSVKMISVPKGFKVTLFAGEPNVRQPIAGTTDERGRLWIVENYTYAERGLNYDMRLRDRIVILDDTDGDGKFDKRTIFWDKSPQITSVAVGFGGVWFLAAPYLYFLPDADKDDVPDGEPQIILDGFNNDTIRHNIVNGLTWGPDGWLYGLHGITATSSVGVPGATASQRTNLNCGVWRYHLTCKRFELVAQGGTNPWGFDFDDHGEMFMINTVIGHLWHVVPGAYYRRMFGSHFNPHIYQVIEQTADHFHWNKDGERWHETKKIGVTDETDKAGGGHAHCGLMFYLSDQWPKKYRNTLFTVNLHGLRINNDRIQRHGNGYVGKHNDDFLKSKDSWFRGVELIPSADGSMYVLDWSDIGECHENDGVHRTSGRIYKVSYQSSKNKALQPKVDGRGHIRRPSVSKSGESVQKKHAERAPNLGKLSSLQLAELQSDPNDWAVRHARRLLQERHVAGEDMTEAAKHLFTLYGSAKDVRVRLRAMWALYGMGQLTEPHLTQAFIDKNEHVRAWAIRLFCDRYVDLPASSCRILAKLAIEETSPLVRLYLASAMRQLPARERFRVAIGLMKHAEDADDRMQPLLIWYGLESAVTKHPLYAVDTIRLSKMPLVQEFIARRLASDWEKNGKAIDFLVGLMMSPKQDFTEPVAHGISSGLRGRRRVAAPKRWDEIAKHLAKSKDQEVVEIARELGVVFGDGRALDQVRAIAKDQSVDTAGRVRAIRTLIQGRPDDLFAILKPLMNDRVVQHEVARALAYCDDTSVPNLILGQFARMSPEGQDNAINTLSSRSEWAFKLLDNVESGRLSIGMITAFHARQIQSFGDEKLSQRLAEVWGEIRDTSEEKKQLIDELRKSLTPEKLKAADLSRGRLAFEKTCSVCHTLYGRGKNVGPDLTGGNRKNLEYLLENIVDPSASVAANFRSSTIRLDGGQVINGVVLTTTDKTVTIQTKQETLTVDAGDIEAIRQTKLSLMPDGVLKTLDANAIRDLFAYLMSSSQVPLPKASQ